MRNIRILLVMALATVACVSRAADAPVFHSMDPVIKLALANDPRTGIAGARLAQANQHRSIATSAYRPDISVGASIGRANYSTDTPGIPDGNRNPASLALNIQQTVWDAGRTASRAKGAEAEVDAARANERATRLVITRDAMLAALDVDLAHKRVATRASNVHVLQSKLDYTRARVKAGNSTRTDVAQARARFAAARAALRVAQAKLVSDQATLAALVGQDGDVQLSKTPGVPVPATLADAIREAATNPQLVAARQSESAAKSRVDGADANLRPRLALVGSLGRDRDPRFFSGQTNYWSTELRLNIPVYTGGANRSAVRDAYAKLDEQSARVQQVNRGLVQQVRSAWARLAAARDELIANKEQQAAAKIALDGMQAEQAAGRRTIIDLLDAQQDVLDANLAVLDARYQQLASQVELAAATGRLGNEQRQLTNQGR